MGERMNFQCFKVFFFQKKKYNRLILLSKLLFHLYFLFMIKLVRLVTFLYYFSHNCFHPSQEQREREKQDLEYAKEIAEDDDDFP